jgi:hypothetical protein
MLFGCTNTDTEKEARKANAIDSYCKLKWGLKIGFSISNQNPGGNGWKDATRQPPKKNSKVLAAFPVNLPGGKQ